MRKIPTLEKTTESNVIHFRTSDPNRQETNINWCWKGQKQSRGLGVKGRRRGTSKGSTTFCSLHCGTWIAPICGFKQSSNRKEVRRWKRTKTLSEQSLTHWYWSTESHWETKSRNQKKKSFKSRPDLSNAIISAACSCALPGWHKHEWELCGSLLGCSWVCICT